MKKAAIIVSVVLVVLVAAVLVAPQFIDWSAQKEKIIAVAEEKTGFNVALDGALDLAIFPTPRLVAEDISVTIPTEGESDSPFIQMDRAEIVVELLPLLQRQVQISTVRLVKPEIDLVRRADGSWGFMTPQLAALSSGSAAEETPAGNDMSQMVAIDALVIEEGAFRYADQATEQNYELSGINMKLRAETLSGPFVAEIGVTYQDTPLSFDIKTGRLDAESDALPLQIEIGSTSPKFEVFYKGIVGRSGRLDLQGDMKAIIENPARLADQLTGTKMSQSWPPALKNSLEIGGLLTATQEQVQYQDVNLSLASVGSLNGKLLLGGFADPASALRVDVDMQASQRLTLDPFVPGSASAKATTPSGGSASASFLPETITLPRALEGKIRIEAAEVALNDMSFDNLSATVTLAPSKFQVKGSGRFAGVMQSEADLDIAFGARSQSAESGQVTLSDPIVRYSVSASADNAGNLYQVLEKWITATVPKGALTGQAIKLSGKGQISERKAQIDDASLSLGSQSLGLKGAYEIRGSGQKPLLTMNAGGHDLDLTPFLPANDPSKKTGAGALPALPDLPFDLKLEAAFRGLKIPDWTLSRFDLAAGLTASKLDIGTFKAVTAEGHEAVVKGSVSGAANDPNLDVALEAKSPDVPALLGRFMKTPPELPRQIKEGRLLAELRGTLNEMSFTANAQALQADLQVSGTASDALTSLSLSNLTVRLTHPNYASLMSVFVPGYSPAVALKKDLDVYASLNTQGRTYKLSGGQATIGPSEMSFDGVLDLSAARPALRANIDAGQLPLDKLLGHDTSQKGTVRAQSAQTQGSERWSQEPIDPSFLKLADLDINIKADRLSYGPWPLEAADLSLGVIDGKGQSAVKGQVFGGSVDARADVSAQGQVLNISTQSTLTAVQLESLTKALTGAALLQAQGSVSLDMKADTGGASIRALISALQGGGAITGQDVVLEGFNLASLSRTLVTPSSSMRENFGNLLGSTLEGGQTQFTEINIPFVMQNGIVRAGEGAALTGPEAVIALSGLVDLPRWLMDMKADIQLTEPEDAPSLPVTFQGPLDQPKRTFGRAAMQGYLDSMVGDRVRGAIQKELDDKLGDVLGDSGLPIFQRRQQQTQEPTQETAPEQAQEQPAQEQSAQEQPAQQQPQRSPEEEAIRGVLECVLGGF